MPIEFFARWGAFWRPRLPYPPYPPSWPRSTTGWSNPAAWPSPALPITATEGDKKVTTTTDEQGAYAFSDLPDGVWTIEVEMFGFAKLSREVGVAPLAPSPTWELNILPPGAAMAANASPAPAAPATPVRRPGAACPGIHRDCFGSGARGHTRSHPLHRDTRRRGGRTRRQRLSREAAEAEPRPPEMAGGPPCGKPNSSRVNPDISAWM